MYVMKPTSREQSIFWLDDRLRMSPLECAAFRHLPMLFNGSWECHEQNTYHDAKLTACAMSGVE